MDVSSSRILVSSSRPNAIFIPTIKMTSSTITKNLINPLQMGDASLQKLRSITTTPVIKPTAVIMSNGGPSIKSEPQQSITVNRLLFSNNSTNSTINLAAFVNSLNQNSISKFLETPISVAPVPSVLPGNFAVYEYFLLNDFLYLSDFINEQRKSE